MGREQDTENLNASETAAKHFGVVEALISDAAIIAIDRDGGFRVSTARSGNLLALLGMLEAAKSEVLKAIKG